MPSHLAYEKYNYAERYMSGLSNVTYSSLVTAVCLMTAVHLVGEGTALPAVSRGHRGFRLMECHLCPSCGCCPWCSIQAVICPGGTGSSSRWHGRWWSQKLEKYFDILPRCPRSLTGALSSKGEGELDPWTPNNPSSSGIFLPRKRAMSLSSWLTYLLPTQTTTTCNSLNPSASLLRLAMTSCMY